MKKRKKIRFRTGDTVSLEVDGVLLQGKIERLERQAAHVRVAGAGWEYSTIQNVRQLHLMGD